MRYFVCWSHRYPSTIFSSSLVKTKRKKRILTEILGDTDSEWQTLIQYSPLYRVKELNIPILLAQGGKDRIVDDEHYARLKYLLELNNKKFESLYYVNEGHGFKWIRNKLNFYNEVVSFLNEHFY